MHSEQVLQDEQAPHFSATVKHPQARERVFPSFTCEKTNLLFSFSSCFGIESHTILIFSISVTGA